MGEGELGALGDLGDPDLRGEADCDLGDLDLRGETWVMILAPPGHALLRLRITLAVPL